MSRAKVKQIARGKIDASRFSSKRKLDIDTDVLAAFINLCKPRSLSPTVETPAKKSGDAPPTAKVVDDGTDSVVETKEVKAAEPVMGENGELIWETGTIVPSIIQSIYDQARTLHNLKEEVQAFSCMIWKPRTPSKGAHAKVHSIPKAPLGIASRIIIAFGGKENFSMSAGAGSMSGEGSVLCFPGESFSVPIGIATAIDFSFNDSTSFFNEAKKGFRAMRVTKDPSRTYVCVVDGLVNTSKLIGHIKHEANKLTGGNVKNSAHLQSKMSEALGISIEDKVADIASRSVIPESVPDLIPLPPPLPVETKEVDDVDSVVAVALSQ